MNFIDIMSETHILGFESEYAQRALRLEPVMPLSLSDYFVFSRFDLVLASLIVVQSLVPLFYSLSCSHHKSFISFLS